MWNMFAVKVIGALAMACRWESDRRLPALDLLTKYNIDLWGKVQLDDVEKVSDLFSIPSIIVKFVHRIGPK